MDFLPELYSMNLDHLDGILYPIRMQDISKLAVDIET